MLRKISLLSLTLAAAIVGTSQTAHAQYWNRTSRWMISPNFGMGVFQSGDITTTGTVSSNGTVFNTGAVFSAGSTFDFSSVKFDDAYQYPMNFGFDIGYGLNPQVELFGGVVYTSASAKATRIGRAGNAGTLTSAGSGGIGAFVANSPISLKLSDYRALQMHAGARYYMPQFFGRDTVPFIGGLVGFTSRNAIKGELILADNGASTGKLPFYDSSIDPMFGLQLGVDWQIGRDTKIGLMGQAIYMPSLSDNDSQTRLMNGLNTINDTSSGWDFPITARAVVAF